MDKPSKESPRLTLLEGMMAVTAGGSGSDAIEGERWTHPEAG